MIALSGPKLKLLVLGVEELYPVGFNDSTEWA